MNVSLPQAGHAAIDRQIERFAADIHRLMTERDQALEASRRIRRDALLRLAAAAELKDDDTGVHIVRMGYTSALIALALDCPDDWSERLFYASRMHDIGKLGIPDSILKKPGPLTADEREVMNRHPELGWALLADSDNPLFQLAAEVALTHHERWDGSGYPGGMAGEAIPLSGRIVGVADFFDALTMDRVYRPAFSDERALAMLGEASGSHFDPRVVTAFFTVKERIIAVRDRVNGGESPSLADAWKSA
ncbi:MAG: HD domain-containing phosphohydrolase [Caulobacter sp.]|nr:HD domain-containing phosphohydrolase [Caulobacter sp.]